MYAPLAQAPASFGPISCLLVNYSPNQSFVPYLKQLASRIAEISRGSQIFDTSLAQTPANFGPPKVAMFLGTILPKPKLCTKFGVASFNGCRYKQVVTSIFGCSPHPEPLQFWSLKLFRRSCKHFYKNSSDRKL